MSIIIVQFNNQQEAQDKMSSYDAMAHLTPPSTLAEIYKHPTLDIWFFSATSCIENAGLYQSDVQQDVESLTGGFYIGEVFYSITFEIETYDELIEMGYW
jgi:pantoate kinase